MSDKRKPYTPPTKGSLRSWMWVQFLKDTPWYAIEQAIIKAGRTDYLEKCEKWYLYWLERYSESEIAGCRAYTSHGWGKRRYRNPNPNPNSGAYNTNSGWRVS